MQQVTTRISWSHWVVKENFTGSWPDAGDFLMGMVVKAVVSGSRPELSFGLSSNVGSAERWSSSGSKRSSSSSLLSENIRNCEKKIEERIHHSCLWKNSNWERWSTWIWMEFYHGRKHLWFKLHLCFIFISLGNNLKFINKTDRTKTTVNSGYILLAFRCIKIARNTVCTNSTILC